MRINTDHVVSIEWNGGTVENHRVKMTDASERTLSPDKASDLRAFMSPMVPAAPGTVALVMTWRGL